MPENTSWRSRTCSQIGLVKSRGLAHGDLDQLLGMADRQGFEDHRIDQAENRGIGADAEARDRIATAANPGLERRARRA